MNRITGICTAAALVLASDAAFADAHLMFKPGEGIWDSATGETTVMTNQIKSIFTDQNIIKRANKTSGLDFRLRHHVICQRHSLPVNSRLQHHGAMAKNWPLLNVDMI